MTAGRRDRIAAALKAIFPRIPARELDSVLDHALVSTGLRKASPEAAAWLSALAVIRHQHTEYDDLLAEGYDVDSARHFTLEPMNAVLAEWGCRRRIDGAEEG